MCKLIKQTQPKARKKHFCDGREQIIIYCDERDPAHKEAVAAIDNCKGIKKGDYYINQFIAESAHEAYTYKSCLRCDAIITKFKFYDN
jgi:hypothetical protein